MAYSTENRAFFQNLPDKLTANFRKKIVEILLLEIEKKESKTLDSFQELLK